MANSWRYQNYAGATITQGGKEITYFSPVSDPGSNADDQTIATKVYGSYTAKNGWCNVSANDTDVAMTLKSDIDTGAGFANGNLSVSITAATTGVFEDTSNTDSLSNGHYIKYEFGNAGLAMHVQACTISATGLTLEEATLTNPLYCSGAGSQTSTTTYRPLSGGPFQTTTEAEAQLLFRVASVLSKARIEMTVNGDAAASTLALRHNGVAGNISVSITASTTGEFEDTANSDSIAIGDTANWQLANGSSGVLTPAAVQVQGDAGAQHWGAASQFFTGSTRQPSITGTTNETEVAITARSTHKIQNLYGYVSTNSNSTSASTLSTRAGAVDKLLVSVPASSTGQFEDTASSYTMGATDAMDHEITPGDAANLELNVLSCEVEAVAAGPSLGVDEIMAAIRPIQEPPEPRRPQVVTY